MSTHPTLASAALLGVLFSAGLVEGQTQFRKVIEVGDPVPEIPGATLKRIGSQSYGNDAYTMFGMSLEGEGVTSSNDGVEMYYTPETGLRLVTRESPNFSYINAQTSNAGISIIERAIGSSAPYTHRTWTPDGSPSVSLPLYPITPYNYHNPPQVKMLTEDTAYFTAVTDSTADYTDSGVWGTDLNGVTPILHSGDSLPEIAPEVIDRLRVSDVDGQRVLIEITPTDNGTRVPNDSSPVYVRALYIYDFTTGQFENIFYPEMPAPGIPGAVFDRGDGSFNPDGSVSYSIRLQTGVGGVTTDNDEVRYVWSNGVSTLFSREGGPYPPYMDGLGVPGVPGAEFDYFDPEEILPGQHLVYGRLKLGLGGVNQQNDRGLWLFRDGGGELLLRDQDEIPGEGTAVIASLSARIAAPQGTSAFTCLLVGGIGGVPSSPSGTQSTTLYRDNASGQYTILPWPSQEILVEDDMGNIEPRTISDDMRAPFLFPSGQYAVRIELLDSDTNAENDAVILFEVPTPCVADTNGDGVLSPADFSAWVAAFNAMSPACDQNNDGVCTPADFSAWVANYNAGC